MACAIRVGSIQVTKVLVRSEQDILKNPPCSFEHVDDCDEKMGHQTDVFVAGVQRKKSKTMGKVLSMKPK